MPKNNVFNVTPASPYKSKSKKQSKQSFNDRLICFHNGSIIVRKLSEKHIREFAC